jgi:tetratricopeptide (TPR) repeat protein
VNQTKLVHDNLGKNAISYYYSAEEFRLRGEYKNAITLYDRAGSLYISKLAYHDFTLTQLKKALVLITLNKTRSAEEIIDQATFWQKVFYLNTEKEIRGVKARLLLAQGKTNEATEEIKALIVQYESNLLLKTYYQALLLESDQGQSNEAIQEISATFNTLFEKYQDKGTDNPDALVYIGKSLLNNRKHFSKSLLKKMESLSRELEIPTLSLFLIQYYKKYAPEDEKSYFQYLIEEIKQKEVIDLTEKKKKKRPL